jgi:RecA/RadA recombinase
MAKDKKEETVDLDKILNQARQEFKNKEKGLGQQLVRGSKIPRPTKECEFVHWRGSAWELMTGIMGCPFGRIIQVAGKPDSGKSTHAMEFMKRAQDQGHIVILWDAENKFSASRFDNYFGGKSEDLLVVTSKLILEGADMVDAYVHSAMANYPNKKIFIVWDSVGGSLPTAELTKSKRQSRQMAEASKENGIVVRGFVSLMEQYRDRETNEDRIGALLINQTYANIGAPGQVESGGQKVAYFSSIILQMTRKKDLFKQRDGVKRKVGIIARARVKKNHLFDGEDSIAELDLEITAGGVRVSKTSPAYKLVSDEQKSDEDFVEEEEGWED